MEIKNLKIFKKDNKKYNGVEKEFIIKLKKAHSLTIRTYVKEGKAGLLNEKSLDNKLEIYYLMLGLLDNKLAYYEQKILDAKKRNTYYNLDNYNVIKNKRNEIVSKLEIILKKHFPSFDIKSSLIDFSSKKNISEYNITNEQKIILRNFTKKCIDMHTLGYNTSMLMDINVIISEYELLSTDIDKQVEINKKQQQLDKEKAQLDKLNQKLKK